jgi:hypothetical protein
MLVSKLKPWKRSTRSKYKAAGFLLGLFFDPEDGVDTFL